MTDQGPRGLIPGQSMLRPSAPYGMTPGVRSVLPGINDMSATAWNAPPKPDEINLDAPIANPPPPGPQPVAGSASAGWQLTDPDGNTVHLRSGAHKQRDTEQVQALGQALLNHAATDGDKAAAGRALDWGMAQVGKANAADITKQMAHMWDQGSNDDLKIELQGMRSKANRGGTGGVPNAAPGEMPDPLSKFGHTLNKDLQALTRTIIQQERSSEKFAALSEHENTMAVMDAAMNSGNAMAERGAVMRRLLEMTGKASRESEQAGITGSAGKWEELKNKLALWTPGTNPSLTEAYISQFRGMIASDRAAMRKVKEAIGVRAATEIRRQAAGYGDEAAAEAADTVYGAMTGRFRGGSYTPPSDAEVSGQQRPPATKPRQAPAAPKAPPPDQYSDLD